VKLSDSKELAKWTYLLAKWLPLKKLNGSKGLANWRNLGSFLGGVCFFKKYFFFYLALFFDKYKRESVFFIEGGVK